MLDISVIIPVYNAAEFLEKAVQSAVQFEEVKEIILIEDLSTDNSLEICEQLSTEIPKVKLFQHPDKGNHGAGAARNLGIEKAAGSFIAFLDADDHYLPNRFDTEKELFKDSKIDGVFNAIGTEYLTEKGKEEFQSKFKEISLSTVNYPAEGEEVFKGLLSLSTKTFGTSFHLNSLTIRKASLEPHQIRFNKELRVHQDSDFIIKLAYHCHLKTGNITEAVAMRGVHDNNRITKIVKYSPQYNQRQFLLWQSLNQWAISNQIPAEPRKRIYLMYKSFDLSLKKGFFKYCTILGEVLKNPEILKTKYRFTYYNR
ncbi:glycosyltransferase family 2 protein [Chryseobacterium sp. BIGb0232]|uniref:glycosyltransferase family 2 protein n=1 Tax=Chryseobacterium sp. BIGb0232 TaxID=2940598 RepID=UPI000F480B2B|nr:glycosyltransferase family 2 protein [Chryseobacterium sp. BIGb0232]MCS4303108.1 glycosyltransferase involved in cell wall biosynthesis [Chryseobacterium sp. BIGb0232]ROS14605.1 glycosyl transferase family 2 [Chryseobacterium nakagawai]